MATVANNEFRKQVMQGLDQSIGEIPKTRAFRTGIFGAALVLTAMFVSYVGILAVLFWLLLNFGAALLTLGGQQSMGFFYLPFYLVGFLTVGAVFLAFLKPMLLKKTGARRLFQLHRKQEPLLFQYVEGICRAVGARAPKRIYVIIESNAAASLSEGPMDDQTDLLIGLPLVYGLNTRQLAGVLAHEFGHFSHIEGMKLTNMVRSMLDWFVTSAFKRDALDEKIRYLSEHGNALFRLLFKVVRYVVWISRLVLFGLVYVGLFFLSRLMQQMEFDADRYEARLVGSQVFAQTSRRLLRLAFSEHQAIDELDYQKRINQLPDNLPLFIADIEQNLKDEKFREVEEERLNATTDWHDTHPCDRDRIENAARENAAGIYAAELPATDLFTDVDAVSKALTQEFYRAAMGQVTDSELNDTRQLLQSKQVVRSDSEAALRFVFHQFTLYDSFHLPRPYLGKAMENDQYAADTQRRRTQLLQHAAAYAKLVQQEEKAWIEWSQATAARTLLEAGYDPATIADKFSVGSIPEAHNRATVLSNKVLQLHSQLQRFRVTIGERLMDALEYMRSEEVAVGAGESPQVADEINQILQIWGTIYSLRPQLEQYYLDFKSTEFLIKVSGDRIDSQTLRVLQATLGRVNDTLVQLQQATLNMTYPFEHGLGKVSVAHFLLPQLPVAQDLGETISVAANLAENLDYLLRRCLSRLCSLSEKVERLFDFEPMEVPAEITGMVKPRSTEDVAPG